MLAISKKTYTLALRSRKKVGMKKLISLGAMVLLAANAALGQAPGTQGELIPQRAPFLPHGLAPTPAPLLRLNPPQALQDFYQNKRSRAKIAPVELAPAVEVGRMPVLVPRLDGFYDTMPVVAVAGSWQYNMPIAGHTTAPLPTNGGR
jgi:hypothetical protein